VGIDNLVRLTREGSEEATQLLGAVYIAMQQADEKGVPEAGEVLNAREIMFRFKQLQLWYHAIVDSGNGYHVYLRINKTNDFKKIQEVTKIIGEKLGADPEGMLHTQILRVPLTFNIKNNTSKQVNIIKQFEAKTIKSYDINKLYNKFCNNNTKDDKTIQYALGKTNFPPCIVNILRGVEDGDRNFCLKRLISFLKVYKYSESEVWNIIKEWNYKNEPPIEDDELEYQFQYIYNKKYNCFGCVTHDAILQSQIKQYCDKDACRNKSKDDILLIEGEMIEMEYKLCKRIEPQRKDVLQLKGNHLLIICVLKNNAEGLRTDEIIQRLTYNGKCSISNKTLSSVLNDLVDNQYITKISGNKKQGQKDFYKFNPIKCEEIEKFGLSYFAVLGVIKENITPEDFKVYCYLRYRLHRGLNLIQEEIANELGISQQSISKHIKSLIDEKYLELKYVNYDVSKFGLNVYKINH
jgi:hypothetical protein